MIEVSIEQFALVMLLATALFICCSAIVLITVLVIRERWENRKLKHNDVE